MGLKTWTAGVAAALLLFVTASVSQAALLGLTQQAPDITSSFLSVQYTVGDGALSVTGEATYFDVDGLPPPDYAITDGVYTLLITVDNTGALQPGGTLTITGTIPDIGANSGLLLTGTVAQFGFLDGGGENFEYLINVTGGDLLPYYGTQAGVKLDAVDSSFNGSFEADFGNDGYSGSSDTFTVPVPEPASAGMLLLGALMLKTRHGRARG